MAVIFQSYFLQKEFQDLYRVLLVELNDCGACGIEKCFYCNKFDASCVSCRNNRCRACIRFFNSLTFCYNNSSKEQWDYLCNFLYDIFRLHDITKRCFFDVRAPLEPSIRNSYFLVPSNDSKKMCTATNGKKKIYYTLGNRQYRFYYNPL